eukprot:1240683-Pyramimonas_sp.AAC.1
MPREGVAVRLLRHAPRFGPAARSPPLEHADVSSAGRRGMRRPRELGRGPPLSFPGVDERGE